MKNIMIGLIVVLLCSCGRGVYEFDCTYKGESNYKWFYLVDTILIKTPVRVFSDKYGGPFVMSREKLKSYDGSLAFFMEPDVFIQGDNLYHDLDAEDICNYVYPDYGGCKRKESYIEIEGLEIYEFEGDVRFILALMNTNMYRVKESSENYFFVPIKYSKSTYIKIVYQLCQ